MATFSTHKKVYGSCHQLLPDDVGIDSKDITSLQIRSSISYRVCEECDVHSVSKITLQKAVAGSESG